MKLAISAIVAGSLMLSACASKKVYYQEHPEFGVVNTKSIEFKNERAICEREAYGAGVKLGEVTVYNTSDGAKYQVDHFMSQLKLPANERVEVPYKDKLDELNRNAFKCMELRGWKKVES